MEKQSTNRSIRIQGPYSHFVLSVVTCKHPTQNSTPVTSKGLQPKNPTAYLPLERTSQPTPNPLAQHPTPPSLSPSVVKLSSSTLHLPTPLPTPPFLFFRNLTRQPILIFFCKPGKLLPRFRLWIN
ncbi:hypothetical protein BS50DRAFT_53254 [Corynespora cassiicola Philippines]|uniref:Uncharacterized protein n=1 Tax=Corynespora cassiicola Philippines TaxID=1448308 RepID=A0A2T2NIE0_CORCC|nr:hypothetical protein BS50DRAFT_53254 [Corynespora cassiicola Philippines]